MANHRSFAFAEERRSLEKDRVLVGVGRIVHSVKHYFEADFVEYFVEGIDLGEGIGLGGGIDLVPTDLVEAAEGGNFLAENSAAAECPLRFVAKLQEVCLYFQECSYLFAAVQLHLRQHRSSCHQRLLDQKGRLSLDL
ncbi:MAG: hypothetical protein CL967_05485 [Euryarchaeota archaeon]|nr:hypothetical protein [Euryarchaeota archaeon]